MKIPIFFFLTSTLGHPKLIKIKTHTPVYVVLTKLLQNYCRSQAIDVANTAGYYQLVTPWSMSTYLNVAAGTYTFTVKARKYIGSNFYASGSTTSPQPNEGALTILVVPQ